MRIFIHITENNLHKFPSSTADESGGRVMQLSNIMQKFGLRALPFFNAKKQGWNQLTEFKDMEENPGLASASNEAALSQEIPHTLETSNSKTK
jgi:hypothetical protein